MDGRAALPISALGALNLIFPVYLKLMTGFPFVYPENVAGELLH